MNEPTANAPHCCPATRWDTEEAGCVFICDGRRRIIKTNPPPPKENPIETRRRRVEEADGKVSSGSMQLLPALPRVKGGWGEGGGGDVSPPAMRLQPPPHCPPCIQWGRSHRGSAGGVCGSAGGVYVQVLCRGDERGRGGGNKDKKEEEKKIQPLPSPQKKKHKPTKAQTGEAVLGWAQGMPNCTTSSSFASTRICERALKA